MFSVESGAKEGRPVAGTVGFFFVGVSSMMGLPFVPNETFVPSVCLCVKSTVSLRYVRCGTYLQVYTVPGARKGPFNYSSEVLLIGT